MEKIEIFNPHLHVAKLGDIYDMTFKTIGVPFLSDFQLNLIKQNLNKNEKFKVIEATSQSGKAVIRIEIVKNPFPIALAISAATTGLVGLFIFLSLTKVEQIINTPEGKTNNLAASIGLAVGIITLGAFLATGK